MEKNSFENHFLLFIYIKKYFWKVIVTLFFKIFKNRLWHTILQKKAIRFQWKKNFVKKWPNDLSGAITQCSLHFKIGKHPDFGPSEPKLQDGIGETSPPGGGRVSVMGPWTIILINILIAYAKTDNKNLLVQVTKFDLLTW